MFWPILFAIASPFFFALLSILSKYTLTTRVKNISSYMVIVGVVYLAITIVAFFFFDWSQISFFQILFPALLGILTALQGYFFLRVLEDEDVSHFSGLSYFYPVLVAILSMIFLREFIPFAGYVGMLLAVFGVILLSVRINKIRLKTKLWFIVVFICILSVSELLSKIISTTLPPLQNLTIIYFIFGLCFISFLCSAKTRQGFKRELPAIPFIVAANVSALLATLFLLFAMRELPATIVAAISVLEVIFILGLEFMVEKTIDPIMRDKSFIGKLIPLLLITGGIVLLMIAA